MYIPIYMYVSLVVFLGRALTLPPSCIVRYTNWAPGPPDNAVAEGAHSGLTRRAICVSCVLFSG